MQMTYSDRSGSESVGERTGTLLDGSKELGSREPSPLGQNDLYQLQVPVLCRCHVVLTFPDSFSCRQETPSGVV